MIKINSLNKYFNKNRTNEVHAIKNFNFEFDEKGLYTIFGESGSGKTTLLNVIAGLDSFDSGSITYGNFELDHYIQRIADQVRNDYFGFIFQNYNLLDNLTVIENIETILDIINVTDENERKLRIKQSLDAVGLYKHRNRNVLALSGGERQRVSIARALAKNPKVIFADEPTGNLDSNNTFEVMNIIKKISKERLVILVSHERELVDFYSDYILEIKDGLLVNSIKNTEGGSLKHVDPRNIYLKDYSKKTQKIASGSISFYKDSDSQDDLSIDVVVKNNELYLRADTPLKVHFVSDSNEIKFIDSKEEDYIKELEEKENNLDLSKFSSNDDTHKKSLTSFFTSIKEAFIKPKYLKNSKLARIGLTLVSIILAFTISNLVSIFDFDEKDYTIATNNTLAVTISPSDIDNNRNINTLLSEIKDSTDAYFSYNDETRMYFVPDFQRFYQTEPYYSEQFDCFFDNVNNVSEFIIEPTIEVKANEIVLSNWVADSILKSSSSASNGFFTYSDLIGLTGSLYFVNDYSYTQNPINSKNPTFKVVGIANTNDPGIYLFNQDLVNAFPSIEKGENTIYMITNDMNNLKNKLSAYSKVFEPNQDYKNSYILKELKYQESDIISLLVVALALFLYLILLVRSSIISKIKDIGILRTVGATKKDIKNIFRADMISLTLRHGFIPYTICFLIILFYSNMFSMKAIGLNIFSFNIVAYIIGIALMLLVNIIVTLIPLSSLLRKTPIEIIKKYDI